MPWKLTVRTGPRVKRERHETPEQVVSAAERHARELAETVRKDTVDVRVRRFEPAEQVVARIEFTGPERLVPSVRAGLDVRGDGSVEAYLGRVRRQVVERRRGENAYRALRRALNQPSAG